MKPSVKKSRTRRRMIKEKKHAVRIVKPVITTTDSRLLLSDVIYEIFTREKELKEREEQILTDSMKEITGGKGFILTNSK